MRRPARLLARNAYNTGVRGTRGVLARHRAAAIVHLRSRRVHRAQPHAGRAGGARSRERSTGRSGAGLDPCGALQIVARDSRRRIAAGRVRARPGARRGARPSSLATRYGSARRRSTRRSRATEQFWDDTLGAVQVHTPDDSFDLLVNRWLLYQTLSCRIWARSGPVSARRRVRLPRSAAGRAGAALLAAGSVPRAPAAGRVAAVRRGRRAALVASAERARHAHALLGRSALAAVRRRRLRLAHRRRRRCSTRWCRSSRRRRSSRTSTRPTCCRRCPRDRRRCSSTHVPRDRPLAEVRRARPAAHRLRRLERRHEPRRRTRAAAKACGSAGSSSSCSTTSRRSASAAQRERSRAALSQRGAMAHRHAGAGVGRRLVSARLLRRRHAARVGAERGVQARFADAVVGGAVAGRAIRRAPSARWTRSARTWCGATRSSCCC